MVILRTGLTAGLVAFASISPAFAQQNLQQMINWCIGKNNPTPQQIAQGCTAAINSKRFKGEILASGYQNRSIAYQRLGKWEEAKKDSDQAVRLAPRSAEVHLMRSNLFGDIGQTDEAIAAATMAISLNPKVTLAHYNRGSLYYRKGEYDKAIVDLDKAISLDPKYGPAYNNRALVKTAMRRFDDALADVTIAIGLLKPNDTKLNKALPLGTRSDVYLNMKKYDMALKDLDAAIVLAPTPQYLVARMALHEQAGKPELGLPDAERLIKMDPNNGGAWNMRCWIHAITGKLEQALADCNKSLALSPDQSATHDSRATVYLKMGKYSEAIADYNAALKFSGYEQGGKVLPGFAAFLYGRGLAREKSGDMLGGTVDMTQAKTVTPDLPEKFAIYLKQ